MIFYPQKSEDSQAFGIIKKQEVENLAEIRKKRCTFLEFDHRAITFPQYGRGVKLLMIHLTPQYQIIPIAHSKLLEYLMARTSRVFHPMECWILTRIGKLPPVTRAPTRYNLIYGNEELVPPWVFTCDAVPVL